MATKSVEDVEERVRQLEEELAKAREKLAEESAKSLKGIDVQAEAVPAPPPEPFGFFQVLGTIAFALLTLLLPPVSGAIILWARIRQNSFAANFLDGIRMTDLYQNTLRPPPKGEEDDEDDEDDEDEEDEEEEDDEDAGGESVEAGAIKLEGKVAERVSTL